MLSKGGSAGLGLCEKAFLVTVQVVCCGWEPFWQMVMSTFRR